MAGLAPVGFAQERGVDPDLMIWWKLDEPSGTKAFDSSGHGTHGFLRGGPA